MKFILTRELGRLAKWLRILGYDSRFYRQDNQSRLIIEALRENRIILTRNSRISRFPGPPLVLIKDDLLQQQLKQLFGELRLRPEAKQMFTRCTICNSELEAVAKSKIRARVPEYVYQSQEAFMRCLQCNRIYWQGTHWGNVKKYLMAANV